MSEVKRNMPVRMKYIVLSDGAKEYGVIFDSALAHVDVAEGIITESIMSKWSKVMGRLKAVSAGFVYLPAVDGMAVNGKSESLKLASRPHDLLVFGGKDE